MFRIVKTVQNQLKLRIKYLEKNKINIDSPKKIIKNS